MDCETSLQTGKTAALLAKVRAALLDSAHGRPDTERLLLLVRDIDVELGSRRGRRGVGGTGRASHPKTYLQSRKRTTPKQDDRDPVDEERLALVLQLDKAFRARDEFLEAVSHELRTPLTALRLQIEGLERKVAHTGSASEGELAQFALRLASARRQTERLIHRVGGLFEVSRFSERPPPLKPARTDLAALVLEVCEKHRDEASRRGCVLNVEAPSSIFGIWDSGLLELLLSHLLTNALKYAPNAPVTIRVDSEEEAAVLSVIDHGMGIPARRLSRIFDRFERAVSSRSYGGLGLGLFVARTIAEAHQGTIAAESREGEGARFVVRLPRERRQPAVANSGTKRVTKVRGGSDNRDRPKKRAKPATGRKRAG